jgi:hypothetical protein
MAHSTVAFDYRIIPIGLHLLFYIGVSEFSHILTPFIKAPLKSR